MPAVDLVYVSRCPHVRAARELLVLAFQRTGISASWSEWDTAQADTPEHLRGFGSPSILIDGRDVEGRVAGDGPACRLYPSPGAGLAGVPDLDQVVRALVAAGSPGTDRAAPSPPTAWLVLPGVLVALLPKVACPACWPLYAALTSALGLGFLLETRWLLPLSMGLLALAIAVLLHRARHHGRRAPSLLAVLGAGAVLGGRFGLDSSELALGGAGSLVLACLLELRGPPAPGAPRPCCVTPAPVPEGRNRHA